MGFPVVRAAWSLLDKRQQALKMRAPSLQPDFAAAVCGRNAKAATRTPAWSTQQTCVEALRIAGTADKPVPPCVVLRLAQLRTEPFTGLTGTRLVAQRFEGAEYDVENVFLPATSRKPWGYSVNAAIMAPSTDIKEFLRGRY